MKGMSSQSMLGALGGLTLLAIANVAAQPPQEPQTPVFRGNARTEVCSGGATPRFILTLEHGFKMTGMDVCIALQNGTPSIHVDSSQAASGIIGFSPACLRPEDPDAIGRRLRELIG